MHENVEKERTQNTSFVQDPRCPVSPLLIHLSDCPLTPKSTNSIEDDVPVSHIKCTLKIDECNHTVRGKTCVQFHETVIRASLWYKAKEPRCDSMSPNRKRRLVSDIHSMTLLKQEVRDAGLNLSVPGLGMDTMVLQVEAVGTCPSLYRR